MRLEHVRPLEDTWKPILEAAGKFSYSAVDRLAPKLEELSRAYNLGLAEGTKIALPIEARIAFSFPRDVPKGAAAIRELLAEMPERVRILDLGAGLGAMTHGAARALGRPVEALLVDEDPAALRTAQVLAKDLGAVTTRTLGLASSSAISGTYDLVFLGQVLSELDRGRDPEDRVAAHAELVGKVFDDFVADRGALVIVEPALRDRTRHLHAVRDRVLARPDVHVFAPCLHRAACPALATPEDWCHEDLPIDLPSWVVPLARAAGLRWQGLTFSYLVLRKVPRAKPEPGGYRFRVTSDLLRTKGKTELFACTDQGVRPRIRLLERDGDFGALCRGDIATLNCDGNEPVDERGRVRRETHVAIDDGPGGR